MTSWLSWEPRRGNKVQPWCELHRPVDHAETHPDPPSFRVSDVVPDQAEPVHPEPGEAARASGSSGDSESERATEGDAALRDSVCRLHKHFKAERPLAENCAAEEAVVATTGALPIAAAESLGQQCVVSRLVRAGGRRSEEKMLLRHYALLVESSQVQGEESNRRCGPLTSPIISHRWQAASQSFPEAGGSETANPNFKETLPGALRAHMGEPPFEALPLAEVEIESDATSASAECLDRSSDQDIDEDWTGEEFAPHDLLMCLGVGYEWLCQAKSVAVLERGLAAKWPVAGVQELLDWRLLSRHTRSPLQSHVLIDHVAEVGNLGRPETIVAFVEQLKLVGSNPDTPFAAVFEGDAGQRKIYQCLLACRAWCTVLASKRKTHFAESHVERIVGENLRSLLRHCRSSDVSLAKNAMLLVMNHAAEALPFVQGPIAEALLGMMEELVESSISANSGIIMFCNQILGMALRVLDKPQRQKWASLLVKLLMDEDYPKEPVIWRLRLLWLADDDPLRTYSEVQHQMKIFVKSASNWKT
ncbi:unnamed protein product, partial [Symbiodinium microadriaticum]